MSNCTGYSEKCFQLSLQLLVLLNFLLDGVSAWLSLEHMFASYLFAGAAPLSLLSVCAVLNGLQEEKKTMVKGTAMLAGIKVRRSCAAQSLWNINKYNTYSIQAVVLLALTLTAVAAFLEEQSTNEQFRPSLELRALLFCVLPLFVCSLSAQYRLSQRVVAWLRLKDQLYVISAPLGDYCQLRGRTLTTTTTMTTGRGSWKRRELNPSSRKQMGGGVKC